MCIDTCNNDERFCIESWQEITSLLLSKEPCKKKKKKKKKKKIRKMSKAELVN